MEIQTRGRRRRATRRCQSGERVEVLIFDQNGAVVCMRKRKPDDVCTSVLSVEVNGIQSSVGESSFLAQGASVLNFQSDGNSNKRLRDHWCCSRQLPESGRGSQERPYDTRPGGGGGGGRHAHGEHRDEPPAGSSNTRCSC